MKYFVLSLHRTGTRSTTEFLAKNLGISSYHHPRKLDGVDYRGKLVGIERDLGSVATAMQPIFDRFDCLGDVPIPTLYSYLAERYPESRFVLVSRNPRDWIRSVRKKCENRPFSPYERVQYWHFFPDLPEKIDDISDEELEKMHLRHNDDVKAFFSKEQKRLGEFSLDDPNLQARLENFLGISARFDFPQTGKSGPRDGLIRWWNR